MKWRAMPNVVVRGRQHACQVCKTPCLARDAGKIIFTDPKAACPLTPPRWRPWTDVLQRSQTIGLGDVVAAGAKPIAAAIDMIAGTDLTDCAGCGERHINWNSAVPDILHPFRSKK
jgi:hypothetical protein